MADLSNTNGSVTLAQLWDMANRVDAWVKEKGSNPNIVYIDSKRVDSVQFATFQTMRMWYMDQVTKTGKEPATIPIQKPADTSNLETYCPTQVLGYGNQNQCVIYLQQKLQDFGFYTQKCDGVFGPYTDSAVKTFQKATGHSADGVVGPITWTAIKTYVVSKPGPVEGDAWVLATLQSKGNVGSEQGLCNLLNEQGTYVYYNDQQQPQSTTVNTLKANCADFVNDLGLPYYRARGIPCRGVHCQVKCNDGKWYGHYIIEINAQGSGDYRDPAGWAKGKGLLELICSAGFKFLHYEGDSIP